MKHQFSRQLVLLLERAYGGRIPSLSALARDISLRAPHLPHVSSEAVRTWIRGSAIPQSPRMQGLVDWLGDDLLEPLMRSIDISRQPALEPHIDQHSDLITLENTIFLLESLDPTDRRLVFELLQSLSRRRSKSRAPVKTTSLTHNHTLGFNPIDPK